MYKLLLVDDEQIIREGLARMIDWEGLGLTLTASCSNALAALDSMTDDMPDILLADVRMPGMDGLELVERAMALHPQLQAIILSGYDTFQYAQQAIKTGVMEYLLKPCSQEELTSALERACRAVDRQRQHVLHLYGERQERIERLTCRLQEIQQHAVTGEQLQKQVHALAKSAEDPGLLQGALINLVTSSLGSVQPEWGLGVIVDAVREQDKLEQLLVRSLTRLRGESAGGRGFIQQMTAYVDGHYQEESLTLQFLADHVIYMNADYIGREFSRVMGKKFSAYLLETRMERAKLLMTTDAGLHSYEVAEQVGLGNNPHYFSQLFRKYTGLTPTEYRSRLENERS
ncbi:MAG TPA: response regulator [Candidatus Egerieenecus merdigallinarum]|nr:response regulator [Candidatus Egerieenecus merdigallinarum]